MIYLPPDKRALQILNQILLILPTTLEHREIYAKKLMTRQIDNTIEVLQFTAASTKDRVYWETVRIQSLKL